MSQEKDLNITEEEFLKTYDASHYERPSFTVDLVVMTIMDQAILNYRKLDQKELKILLIKRGQHPFKDQWALPGGFVQLNESIDQAAYRELKEETNLDQLYLEQLYTWGDVNRDPRTRIISTSYLALIPPNVSPLSAGDDAADADWFSLERTILEENTTYFPNGFQMRRRIQLKLQSQKADLTIVVETIKEKKDHQTSISRKVLESKGLAFDHGIIITYAFERLQAKVDYTDIVFNLMPKEFTLTQLQQAYEVILGEELLTANFRRKIKDKVHETNHVLKDAGHRPAKLFLYNNLDESIFY